MASHAGGRPQTTHLPATSNLTSVNSQPSKNLLATLRSGVKVGAQNLAAAAQGVGDAITAGLRTCDDKHVNTASEFVPGVYTATLGSGILEPGRTSHASQIWGNKTFQFELVLETDKNEGKLVAKGRNGMTHSDLGLRCRWKRKIGDFCLDIAGASGSCYHLSPDDISCSIMVEATPSRNEPGSSGVAFGEIGPFLMDASTRRNLYNILAKDGCPFPIKSAGVLEDSEYQIDGEGGSDLRLEVSEEMIKVVRPGPNNVGYTREWPGSYGADYPRLDVTVNHPTEFELRLGPKSDECLKLVALNRRQRDLLVLTVRCFHARLLFKTSTLMEQISRRNSQVGSGDEVENEALDLFVLTERLNDELCRCLEVQEKARRERDRAITEKDALEQDIAATIESFQQLLEQHAHEDSHGKSPTAIAAEITQRAAHTAELETRLKDAEFQSRKYIEELELLRRDYQLLKQKRSNDEYTTKMRDLQEQLTHLQKLNFDLTQKDQMDKSSSDRKLKFLETENSELKQSFLFIKDKYDDMKRKQAASEIERSAASESQDRRQQRLQDENRHLKQRTAHLEDDLEKLQQRLETIVTEKNRLTKMNDSLAADLEKSKSKVEATSNSLMSINKQLISEKEVMERKLRKLEITSTTQKQTITQIETRGSVRDLEEQLQQKDEMINDLKRENDKLRTQIRRLAKIQV